MAPISTASKPSPRRRAKKPAGVMLTRGIADAYRNGRGKLAELPGVREIGAGEAAQTDRQAGGALYEVGAQAFLAEPAFSHEVFGPASLIVRCRDLDEVARVLEALEGQLTATLQMDADDKPLARRLLPILNARRAACWSTATRPASRCATRWCTAAVPGHVEPGRHVGRCDGDRAFPAAGVLPGFPGRSAAGRVAGKQSARDSAAAGREGGVIGTYD